MRSVYAVGHALARAPAGFCYGISVGPGCHLRPHPARRPGTPELAHLFRNRRRPALQPADPDHSRATSRISSCNGSGRPAPSRSSRPRRWWSTAFSTPSRRPTMCTRSTPSPAASSGPFPTLPRRKPAPAADASIAVWRFWATRCTWERSTRICSRSTPRPARSSGTPRSVPPPTATPSRTLR